MTTTGQGLGAQLAALAAALIVLSLFRVTLGVTSWVSAKKWGMQRAGRGRGYRLSRPGVPSRQSDHQVSGWQWGQDGWQYVTQTPATRVWPGAVIVFPVQRPPAPSSPAAAKATGAPSPARAVQRRYLSHRGAVSIHQRARRR
jgi:hypothetical protein